MKQRELTDAEWALLKPLLPPQPAKGLKRGNDRRTLNGIIYVLKTGCR